MGRCNLCGSIGTYDMAGYTEACGDWRMGLFSDYTQPEGGDAVWTKGIYFGRFRESGDPRFEGASMWHEEAFFPARFCPLCGREL